MNTQRLSAALTAGVVMWMGVAIAWAEPPEPSIIDLQSGEEPGVVTISDRGGVNQYNAPQVYGQMMPASAYSEQPAVEVYGGQPMYGAPIYGAPPEAYGPIYTPGDPGDAFNCDPGCHDCCGCVYGAEFVYLGGHFDPGNEAFTTQSISPAGNIARTRDFDFDEFSNGSRMWAGYVGSSGFGARVTYFEYDADVQAESFTALNNNTAIIGPEVRFLREIELRAVHDRRRAHAVLPPRLLGPERRWWFPSRSH
jgi:hypothetical protein